MERNIPVDPFLIKINIGLSKNNLMRRTGIGLIAKNSSVELQTVWGLNEDAKDNLELEATKAIRLALIKAIQKGWMTVQIELENKGFVDRLLMQNFKHVVAAVLLEDILALKYLFHVCSFCYVDGRSNVLSNKVVVFA
ncbi:hypothetical protein ACH5RR_013446 [Cinchona calisaya]|uniref:RNase H type-1 domain-containing protein n=1 Tax=Cinchona calisaya TaxID=153742 RepID=A0ABD3A017_9GENT